ncbi:MAG: family 43 glycosylhydrolase [Planctomycetota bacterium]|nr:family 43 glycosylhydrolase [Planctomycetota bacterium]
MMRRIALALLFGLLPGALAAASPQMAFRPGDLWLDNNGVHINAHGGGILVHDGVFYASEDNGTLQISQLTADYLRPVGKYVRVLPGGFNEAPAVLKHAGKYYLFTSGCTGWAPNAARLAVADSIWGPWKALGNPCAGKHASLTFHGQSTHILPVPGKPRAFIFMADQWRPKNAIDGRHLWLPIQFKDGRPLIEWMTDGGKRISWPFTWRVARRPCRSTTAWYNSPLN